MNIGAVHLNNISVWITGNKTDIDNTVSACKKGTFFIVFAYMFSLNMLWILERSISRKWFFRVPKTYTLVERFTLQSFAYPESRRSSHVTYSSEV